LYGLREFAGQAYGNLGKPGQWIKGQPASACLECGECEPKCPQTIPIVAQLKEVARTLGK
ncbi:MAG: 4Fe-4S dicluster domain-containing protein, partial [Chloroflexota bacterium]|nr:4Fe-4S dicluster domain-containing protein [Chloroflexota bacterium]